MDAAILPNGKPMIHHEPFVALAAEFKVDGSNGLLGLTIHSLGEIEFLVCH